MGRTPIFPRAIPPFVRGKKIGFSRLPGGTTFMAMSDACTHPSGDAGFTRLGSGESVPKDDVRLEALGDLDELNSLLGFVRAHAIHESELAHSLERLQQALFAVGAEVAAVPGRSVSAEMLEDLRQMELAWARRAPRSEGFVVPGATKQSARLDVARAVARRVERRLAGLFRQRHLDNPHLLAWANRLSHVLWHMARTAASSRGGGDV